MPWSFSISTAGSVAVSRLKEASLLLAVCSMLRRPLRWSASSAAARVTVRAVLQLSGVKVIAVVWSPVVESSVSLTVMLSSPAPAAMLTDTLALGRLRSLTL